MNPENERLIARKPAMFVARKVIQANTADPIKKIKIVIMAEHGKTGLEAVPGQMTMSHPMPM